MLLVMPACSAYTGARVICNTCWLASLHNYRDIPTLAGQRQQGLPLDDSLSEGGQGVQVGRPGFHQLEQVGMVGGNQQEAVEHHLVHICPQLRVCSGQDWCQDCQLAGVGEQVHPPLPGCCVFLHSQEKLP